MGLVEHPLSDEADYDPSCETQSPTLPTIDTRNEGDSGYWQSFSFFPLQCQAIKGAAAPSQPGSAECGPEWLCR